eukprot:gnl/MRDRNA2_/MRDRNA2_16715_c0_seq1.p1 gnl/MRDRNA2_/MRDRNA2_16715_c0~~gnl/MRDRNA2_/MRDRNA2_16715_c0_seq1.p1  ORF type:complete len:259 (-),score=38.59 gnl/MRDRNA2_/MRDRNA2_16715_c0_seq1:116-892(-)
MTNLRTLFGSCLCRSVQFFVRGPPMQVFHCHCSVCRRAAGAAFATWASFPLKRTHFTGWAELRSYDIMKFCGACGSTIAIMYPESHPFGEPNSIGFTAALLGPAPSSVSAKHNDTPAIVNLQWAGESQMPGPPEGLADGPGDPMFGKPTHIFTSSQANWVAFGELPLESQRNPLLRCAGVTSDVDFWDEVNGPEEFAPQHDLGAKIDPVASSEERYALRSHLPPPDNLKNVKTYQCDVPPWVGTSLLCINGDPSAKSA